MDYEIEYGDYNALNNYSQQFEIICPELIDMPFGSALMINEKINLYAKREIRTRLWFKWFNTPGYCIIILRVKNYYSVC